MNPNCVWPKLPPGANSAVVFCDVCERKINKDLGCTHCQRVSKLRRRAKLSTSHAVVSDLAARLAAAMIEAYIDGVSKRWTPRPLERLKFDAAVQEASKLVRNYGFTFKAEVKASEMEAE